MINQEDFIHIRNILTLRYDPTEAPGIQHKSWKDWSPTESDPEGSKTEDILNYTIVNELMDYDKIAISLSSGVDSSLLLAMIRDAFPEKKIVAIHYAGVNNDELESTKKLAIQFDAELKILYPAPVIDRIEFMIKMMNSPKWDCYDYVIAEKAKQENCDILVTGDGSDELFAGYTFRYQKFLHWIGSEEIFNTRNKDEQISCYLACHNHDYVEDQEQLFQNNKDHTTFNFLWHIHPYFYETFHSPLSPLAKVILADYNGKLCHNFTVKTNKFSQQFEIPILSPFLAPDMKNYATHIPLEEKYHNGIGKLPLRKLCNKYGIEPPLKKLGFTHDIRSEWKKRFNDYIKIIYNDQALIYKHKLINLNWLKKNYHSQEERVINKMVSLYALEKYLLWKQ